jgi:hypothetical protein
MCQHASYQGPTICSLHYSRGILIDSIVFYSKYDQETFVTLEASPQGEIGFQFFNVANTIG